MFLQKVRRRNSLEQVAQLRLQKFVLSVEKYISISDVMNPVLLSALTNGTITRSDTANYLIVNLTLTCFDF